MILQCEQCNTRFRLDDSKLKPGGVKVRCSKCRHVFIAGADHPQEETDFDAILSGLGAPSGAPATAAPPAPEPSPAVPPREEPAEAPAEEPAPKVAAESAPAPADFSFELPQAKEDEGGHPAPGGFAGVSEFTFEPEPAAESPAAPPFAPSDFSFDFEPSHIGEKEQLPPTEEMAGFNEFSFDAEPSAKELEPPPSGTDLVGFQEFSFDEEPSATAVPAADEPKAGAQDLDLGDFSFEEPAAETAPKPAFGAAVGSDFDFGDFSFDEQEEEKPVREFDLSDFTFEGDADQAARELAESMHAEPETGGFAFSEEGAEPSAAARPEPAGDLVEHAADSKAARGEESFSFGDDLVGTAPAVPAAHFEEPAAESAAPPVEEAGAPAAATGEGMPRTTVIDFDRVFGDSASAEHVGAPEAEEELPPLGISSRHRGRPLVTASLAVLSLLLVAALAGAGYYLMKGGPGALNRLGLGAVAQWFGLEGAEEGRIVIVNPMAAFYQNREAGELFVVSGQAENQFRKPRASIHVKVSIFDKSGKVLVQKTAYCGNRLSEQQLTTLPMAKLDAAMNNQFGDSLSNLGVKAGDKIPFVVAIANVPKEAADFGVEVIGSTVAGQ